MFNSIHILECFAFYHSTFSLITYCGERVRACYEGSVQIRVVKNRLLK